MFIPLVTQPLAFGPRQSAQNYSEERGAVFRIQPHSPPNDSGQLSRCPKCQWLSHERYIWVTGANGLLGSALCGCGSGRGGRVHLATTRTEADVGDFDSLWRIAQQHQNITHIINGAAFSLVDLAEERREEAYRVNVLGPRNLAEVARRLGAQLIHISTDYVFQGNLYRPLNEQDETVPCNYYGETKLLGEKEVLHILPTATILRTSWIFGRGGKSFVTRLVEQLQEKEEIQLTDDQWGRATYVHDLVEAIFQIVERPGLYHFAGHGITTRYRFACAMKEEMEAQGIPIATVKLTPVPGTHFPSPAIRPRYSALDTSAIEQLIGPIRPWRDGLREYLLERFYA